MAKCKHNQLVDKVKNGKVPRTNDQYYCSQCQSWVIANPVNQEADRRAAKEREDFKRLVGV